LTAEELEEEQLHEMEKVMQQEAEVKQEQERVAAEEALSKVRRQEEWVRLKCAVMYCNSVIQVPSIKQAAEFTGRCGVVSTLQRVSSVPLKGRDTSSSASLFNKHFHKCKYYLM